MQATTRLVSAAALAALTLAAAGCGNARQTGEIEVLCGGSFRPPMEKLAKQFEEQTGCRAVLVFGQSEDHLPKVKDHVIGDVFVSHDPYVDYTKEAGALSDYVTVGHVAPVLVVRKGNPKRVERFEDLARPGLRVVLPNPEYSTCGKMVFALLDKKDKEKPGFKKAVLDNVGNAMVRSHATTATQIKLGHRDAGIMWNGMAHNWLDAIDIIPEPYQYDEEVRVTVMGLSYSKKKDLVKKFLEFAGTHGKRIFAEFGYTKTTTAPSGAAEENESKTAAKQGKLLLFCGAGIRPAAAEVAGQFGRQSGVSVQCDYAGSEVLLSRIKLTRQGDLYMPGDVYYVDQAMDEGLVTSQKNVCYFVPVILVRKGNPKNVRTLADLTRPGIKVGLGDSKACAIGRKCSEIFAKNNISEDDVNVVYRSLTVNELGNHVKLGTLDAAIVWDAVAAYFANSAETVSIPREQNVISTVAVGVLKCSEQPELAAEFVEFITSAKGRAIFEKHHFATTKTGEKHHGGTEDTEKKGKE